VVRSFSNIPKQGQRVLVAASADDGRRPKSGTRPRWLRRSRSAVAYSAAPRRAHGRSARQGRCRVHGYGHDDQSGRYPRAHRAWRCGVLRPQRTCLLLEGGAPASLSGVLPRLLPGVRGIFGPDDVVAALGMPHPFFPTTIPAPVRLLCVENTHNIGGGSIWPLEQMEAVVATARKHGIAAHLDGARLWHASAKTGVSEAQYSADLIL
jgi:hypothetical protein